jgi:hypothetical protein
MAPVTLAVWPDELPAIFDLSEPRWQQCPYCGMIDGDHTSDDCAALAYDALHAFGEVIATVARAALIRDAALGHTIAWNHEPQQDGAVMTRVRATYWRDEGGWSVCTVEWDNAFAVTLDRVAIMGTPENTAALVVETVLREAERWSEARAEGDR